MRWLEGEWQTDRLGDEETGRLGDCGRRGVDLLSHCPAISSIARLDNGVSAPLARLALDGQLIGGGMVGGLL
jgi:hypothetical protein